MDIYECLGVDVLGLVGPWLQFSVFENGRSIIGRVGSHGRQSKCDKPWGTQLPLAHNGWQEVDYKLSQKIVLLRSVV